METIYIERSEGTLFWNVKGFGEREFWGLFGQCSTFSAPHCFPSFSLHSFSPGYGNIAPSTEGGKIFCILYAIFGIPLFGFLLAGIGDQLGTIFGKSIARVEKVFRVSTAPI